MKNIIPLSTKEAEYLKALIKDRKASIEALQKTSFRNMWNTVVGMYSEVAHFVFELLQNADDVKATYARFDLTPHGLYFAHNGLVHFSISDPSSEAEERDGAAGKLGHLNSITSIGNSSKRELGVSQIGKFGIGFKSVFLYTLTPEVYDPPFCFKLTNYVVPALLTEDHPNRKEGETLFYFPFNHPDRDDTTSYNDILHKLKQLGMPTLFMRHLRKISWQALTEDGEYEMDVQSTTSMHGCDVAKIHTLSTVNNETANVYLLRISQEATHEGKKYPYSLAYLQDEKGNIMTDRSHPLYCFFPTRVQPNLSFILHAPFLLTDNREGIKDTESWNSQLLDNLAMLMNTSLKILRDRKELTTQVFLAMPFNQTEIADKRFHRFHQKFTELIRSNEPIFPEYHGKGYVPLGQAIIGESERLVNLFGDRDLEVIFGKKLSWVLRGVNSRSNETFYRFISRFLEFREIDFEELAFQEKFPTLVESKEDSWFHRLYDYLRQVQNIWELIVNIPIFRTESGKTLPLEDEDGGKIVFLPIGNEKSLGYDIPKKEYLDKKQNYTFFEKFGLEQPDEIDEINLFVLPLYASENKPIIKEHYGHIAKIFRYWNKLGLGQKRDFLQKISSEIYLLGELDQDTESYYWVRPQEFLYLRKPDLIQYFGFLSQEADYPVYWVPLEDYLKKVEVAHTDRNLFELFLKNLGVSDQVKLITENQLLRLRTD